MQIPSTRQFVLSAVIPALLMLALVGCASAPSAAPAQSDASAPKRCKTTRNMQSPGPQPPSNPPRCDTSIDAGKLPATVLPPIIVAH